MKTRLVLLGIPVSMAISAVVLLWTTSLATAAPIALSSSIWRDDFNSPTLDSRWSWIREDPTHWSLTAQPGFLRITLQQGLISADTNRNMLVQNVPAGDFEIQTHLFFTPTENVQRAGLVAYQDGSNQVMLLRAYCGFPGCPGNAIYFDQIEQGQAIGSNYAATTTLTNEVYLRLTRQGIDYTGYMSDNGIDWTLLGTHTVVNGFVPSGIGFMVDDCDFGTSGIPADYDFFLLNDKPHDLFLPLIIR